MEGIIFIDSERLSEIKILILIYRAKYICASKKKIMCIVIHKETFIQCLLGEIFDN